MPHKKKQSIKEQLLSIVQDYKSKKKTDKISDDKFLRYVKIVTPIATVIGVASIFIARKFRKDNK